jgi:hypothetical protein
VGAHARNDSVDVFDGEHDATEAQRVHRCVHRTKPDRVGRVELVQLNALPIGSPHHREGGPDILEPDQSADQGPFDCRFALELEAKFDEERLAASRSSTTMRTLSIRLSVIFFLSSLHC